ncbi:MAG: hypothetical protein GYB58_13765 [Gammaproteobacteria bacterium]|nr:hypothetical protein [Gammaproteobacteria bacterium]
MDLQTYTKAGLLSAIMLSFSAYPLHTLADSLGGKRGEVCATILGSDFTACPQDFTHHKIEAIELCLTALDYTSNDVNCAGALNTAIDNAVASEAGFHELMSIENKSEHVIEIISPLNSDFATLKNRSTSTFRLINKFVDGSELVLDVRKKGGVVEIVVNRDASFISDGRTFRHAEDYGTSSQRSLREAKRVATSQNIPKRCEQPTFDNTDWVVEEVITINYPDGRTEVTNIYRQEDTYITYLQC